MKRILIILILSIVTAFTFAADSVAQMSSDYVWTNKAFLSEVNRERNKKGLKTLKENADLNKIAQQRLDDMIKNNYFSHDSPDGLDVDNILKKSAYKYSVRGENLAYGEFIDEKDVVTGWMGSKWHRYNILYKKFEEVGTAYAVTNYMGGYYVVVVQVFATEKKKDISTKSTKPITLSVKK